MDIRDYNLLKYNQAKEKIMEIIELIKNIRCDTCLECPLYENEYCSRYDLIENLQNSFNVK